MELLGYIGSICFAICGLPQAIQSYKDKHSDGVNTAFLMLWLIGEICTLAYAFTKDVPPLIINYLGNLIFISVIVYYKLFPKRLDK
jgi:uncharacterized protein with PQ loop repeat